MSAYRSTDKVKKEHAEKRKLWRQKNPDKQRAIVKRNYEKHSLRVNAEKTERYKNDAEYRAKIHETDKRYKESGRRREVNSTPENRKKAAERRKKRYYSNVEREKEEIKKFHLNNPGYRKMKSRERYEKLPDSYLFREIKRHSKLQLSIEDMPKEILEVKRNMILLKREIGIKGNQKY